MKKNLGLKTALIVVVLLVFLYGIFGIPNKLSGDGLASSILDRIHLGLDLKGGTHLILQVQVNEAVNADSEQAIERLKTDLKTANINYSEIGKPDPQNRPEQIVIKGVGPEAAGTLRSIANDKLPDYDLASAANNTWTLTMKPSAITAVKNNAVQQAIETIRNRIDKLGVSEPVIQEHGLGDYQVLVQLPGVDDQARVKEVMQSTAMLEIRQSLGGPYASQAEAMQAHGGVLPPDAVLMPGRSIGGRNTDQNGEAWYLISRTAAVSGRDLRPGGARITQDENGKPQVSFLLTGEGGRRFAAFTRAHLRDSLAVVLDNKVQEVATIEDEIHDCGVIRGSFTQQQSHDLAL